VNGRRPSSRVPYRIWSNELELTEPLAAEVEPRGAGGRPFDAARLLVRGGGEPLGFVYVPFTAGRLTAFAVRQAIADQLGLAIEGSGSVTEDAIASTWPSFSDQPITVVVSTRDRPQQLRRCIAAILGNRHRELELVVVDSASRDDSTHQVVSELAHNDGRVRYVHEARPGLSTARNRGLLEARTRLLAFCDDDAIVDPLWVSAIVRGFSRRSDLACVTGMLASASLERPAEQYYDRRLAWSMRCQPCLYTIDGPGDPALYPYAPGSLGGGSNLAFATEVLGALGGFDESLGAGTPAGGGEDLDIFVRLLRAGYAVSYEPAALVWHEHRHTMQEACRQTYAYGKGLSAYVTKYLLAPESRREILVRGLAGVRRAGIIAGRSGHPPPGAGPAWPLATAEVLGFLAGPIAYLVSRSRQSVGHRRAVAP
jgi:glycosyltransferase involved in cell wall biosynthesis